MNASFPTSVMAAKGLVLATLLVGAGLTASSLAVAQTASAPKGSTQGKVVATIGKHQVTEGDLDAFVAPQLMSLRQQRQEVLEKGLDAYLSREVLQREAKARKTSVQALIAAEVTSKLTPVTDAQVHAFYESKKEQIAEPETQISPRIKQYLQQQQERQALADYTTGLKMKYDVQVTLEPLRIDVDAPGEPVRGPADAPITLVEFGDFQCPYCAGLESTLAKVLKNYGDKVRVVFRQFPLESIHPYALKAAEASLCAHEQGKFWALHDRMYANQDALGVDALKAAAAKLGLDTNKFNQCLASEKYLDKIRADQLAGESAGVTGTPALFVNGRPVPGGAVGYDVLAKVIDDELARQKSD